MAGDRADDARAPWASWWLRFWSDAIVVPVLFRWAGRIELPGTATALALITAFGLAWLADRCGSAMIIGAFAAGLLVVRAPQSHEIERGITEIGHFFVPLFFVAVGASVDLSALNPLESSSRQSLLIGLVLILTGVAGKLAAGYAPFWFRGNKTGHRRRHGAARRSRPDLRPGRARLRGLRRGPLRRRHHDGDRHDPACAAGPQVSRRSGGFIRDRSRVEGHRRPRERSLKPRTTASSPATTWIGC